MSTKSYNQVPDLRVDLRCLVCRTEYSPTSLEDAKRWLKSHDHSHFDHTPDEPKERQPGEQYLAWLQRTLSFARTYGDIIDCGCDAGHLVGFAGC